jgi:glycine cleavage system H protein
MSDTSKLKYTPTHEWVRLSGAKAVVGITDHAQKEISDVVFVELPKENRVVKQKESAMVIESVKAAFDIYAPLSGKILRVNDALKDKPELVNRSPYDEGWLFELECGNPKEYETLLSEQEYHEVKESSSHH